MFKKIIAFLFTIICTFSITAYASNNLELIDFEITQSEFEALEHSYAEYAENSTRTSGLITNKSLAIAKSGNSLIITGKTVCNTDIKKCGFKTLTIQYRTNSNSSWEDYAEYEKLYIESYTYNLSKSVTVTSGYQYRVVGKHYAYKNLFQTETIEATTGYLQF